MILGQSNPESFLGRKTRAAIWNRGVTSLLAIRHRVSKVWMRFRNRIRGKRRLRRNDKIKVKFVIEGEILRLCVVEVEMPLTVTRGNPWGVPASIRVLSKRSSPALPPRKAIPENVTLSWWNRRHVNHNRSCFSIDNRSASRSRPERARGHFDRAYRAEKWNGPSTGRH